MSPRTKTRRTNFFMVRECSARGEKRRVADVFSSFSPDFRKFCEVTRKVSQLRNLAVSKCGRCAGSPGRDYSLDFTTDDWKHVITPIMLRTDRLIDGILPERRSILGPSSLLSGAIEPHRVAAQYGFFIFLTKVVPFKQLVDLVAALGGVKNFVRKIAAKQE